MSDDFKILRVIVRQNVLKNKLLELFSEAEVKRAYEELRASGYMDKIDKIMGTAFLNDGVAGCLEERRMLYLLEEALGSELFYGSANCDLKKTLCLLLKSDDFMAKIDAGVSIISPDYGYNSSLHDGWRN